MAWIELHQSLPTHRKTLALADALNIEPVHAVGHLACLWMWALDNAPDGNLADIGARTIARAAQWKRNPEKFLAALSEAGFLEAERIHDWPDYAGRLVERRRRDAERKRTERGSPPDVTPPVPPSSNGHPKDVPPTSYASRAHITVPNPTVPNRTQPESPLSATPTSPQGAAAAFSDEEQELVDAVVGILEPFSISHDPQMWRTALDTYGGLDLQVEAVKQADWLHRHRKRTCSAARYFEWLDRALAPPQQQPPQARPTPITSARAAPQSAGPQPVPLVCVDCGAQTYRNDPDSPYCYPCFAKQKKSAVS